MKPLLLFAFLPTYPFCVLAGNVAEGGTCIIANDKTDPSSHKFVSDCDDQTYCSDNTTVPPQSGGANTSLVETQTSGQCVRRKCRKDEFPFGYAADEALPPMCSHGTACPDNGSVCQPLVEAGSSCDMDRDYQCAPSPNGLALASALNYNGSVCLQSTCMYANVTTGLPCILERTTYSGLDHNYASYNITLQRDNCVTSYPRLYCGSSSSLCERMKELGDSCGDDRECLSLNCGPEGACSAPAGRAIRVELWQYALTALSVLFAIIAICTFLSLAHKRRRMERYYEVLEYFHEQTSLRASIVSLHAAAAQRLALQEKQCELQH